MYSLASTMFFLRPIVVHRFARGSAGGRFGRVSRDKTSQEDRGCAAESHIPNYCCSATFSSRWNLEIAAMPSEATPLLSSKVRLTVPACLL